MLFVLESGYLPVAQGVKRGLSYTLIKLLIVFLFVNPYMETATPLIRNSTNKDDTIPLSVTSQPHTLSN